MKYLEVTFTTHPCNETVNDVVSALAGEIGFESFVECEAGVQAYIQQTLFDEEALKEMIPWGELGCHLAETLKNGKEVVNAVQAGKDAAASILQYMGLV